MIISEASATSVSAGVGAWPELSNSIMYLTNDFEMESLTHNTNNKTYNLYIGFFSSFY